MAQDTATPQWRRLLDLDGDLAEALGPDIASRARDRVGVATVTLAPGAWQPHALAPYMRKAFALIVCDGMVVREQRLAVGWVMDREACRAAEDVGIALVSAGDTCSTTQTAWARVGGKRRDEGDERFDPTGRRPDDHHAVRYRGESMLE